MTLTELRYIVILAEEQHFGRTAERCHVSQPTLSIAVRKLEESLGCALFERTKTKVKPTLLGEKIVAQAARVLANTEVIRTLANTGKDQLCGPLRLGSIFTMGPYFLPQLIPYLKREAPLLALLAQEDYTANLRQKLRAGDLDVILVSLPFSEPDVVIGELFEEPLVLVLPQGHALAHKAQIAPADIPRQSLLLAGEGHCLRAQQLALLPPALDLWMDTDVGSGTSLETQRYLVAAGLGLALLPRSAAGEQICAAHRLVARPLLLPQAARKLALAWRASFPRHKAIDLLRRALQTCSGSYWSFTTDPVDEGQSAVTLSPW